MELTLIVAIAGLTVTIIGAVVTLVWKLSRVEVGLRSEFETGLKGFSDKLTDRDRAHAEMVDALRREFGESLHAIRNKVHELETWVRDEFVREPVINRLEKSVESLGEKIERRLDKMAERIEKLSTT